MVQQTLKNNSLSEKVSFLPQCYVVEMFIVIEPKKKIYPDMGWLIQMT